MNIKAPPTLTFNSAICGISLNDINTKHRKTANKLDISVVAIVKDNASKWCFACTMAISYLAELNTTRTEQILKKSADVPKFSTLYNRVKIGLTMIKIS